jgi:PAS domain S-box-containing protein
MKNPTTLKILLATPHQEETQQIRRLFQGIKAFKTQITTITTEPEAQREIAKNNHDLYLLGFRSLVKAVTQLQAHPLIFLTDDHQEGISLLDQGIADYLERSSLNRFSLEKSIRQSVNCSQIYQKYERLKQTNFGLGKLLEIGLQENNKTFHNLIKNINVGFAIIDVQAHFSSVNSFICNLLGYSEKELLGRSIFEYIDPKDLAIVQQQVQQCHSDKDENQETLEQFISQEVTWRNRKREEIYTIFASTAILDAQKRCQGLLIIITDITQSRAAQLEIVKLNQELEQKVIDRTLELEVKVFQLEQVKKSLQESKNRLKHLVKNAPLILYIINPEGKILFLEGKVLDQINIEPQQIVGKTIFEIPLDNYDFWPKMQVTLTGKELNWTSEYSGRFYENCTTPLRNEKEDIIGLIGVALDVTENHEMQLALTESETRFRQLAENIESVFWLIDLKTNDLLYVSPAYEKIWGYSCEELYQRSELWLELVHPEDQEKVVKHIEKEFWSSTDPLEYRIIKSDGSIHWIQSRSFPISNEQGEVYRLAGIAEDITDRKTIEQALIQEKNALRESEKNLLLAQKIAHLGYWVWYLDNNEIDWSDEIYLIFGFEVQEFAPNYQKFLDFVHPEDRDFVIQSVNQALANHSLYSIDHRIILPNGEIHFVHEQGDIIYDHNGQPIRIMGTVQDITEVKKITLELQESEARFRELVEHIEESFWVNPPNPTVVTYISPAYEKIWGRSCQSLLEDGSNWIESVHPDDRESQILALEKMAQGERFDQEYRIIRPDGSIRWVHAKSTPIYDENGQLLRHVGICHNTTERKQIEIALRDSEARFHGIFNQAAMGIVQIKLTGEFALFNQKFADLVGYSDEELLAMTWQDLTYSEDIEICAIQFQQMLDGSLDKLTVEKRYVHKQGHLIWIKATASFVFDAQGNPEYLLGLVEDITEKKQIQQALIASETRFRGIFEQAAVGIALFTASGHFLKVNQKYCDLTGYSQAELLKKNFAEITYPEDIQFCIDNINQMVEGNLNTYSIEKRFIHPSGKLQWVNATISFISDPEGKIEYFVGVVEDIQERKEAELALQAREKELRLITDALPVCIGYIDQEERYIFANKTYKDWFGYEPQELKSKTVLEVIGEAAYAKVKDKIERVLSGEIVNHEAQIPYLNGGLRHVIANLIPNINNDQVEGYYALITDITERKRSELKLQESEQEFRAAFEQAAVSMVQADLTGKFTKVNQKFCDYLGYLESELLQLDFAAITYPDDMEISLKSNHEILAGEKENFTIEKRYLRKDGKLVWAKLFCTLIRHSDGSPKYFLGVIEDTTQRKEAEAALKASEHQLKLITDSLPVCISYIDSEQRYRFANQTYKTWFGYEPETVYDKTVLEVIGETGYANVKDYLERVLGGEIVNYETEVPYLHGGTRYIIGNLVPDIIDNQVKGYYALISDISERKQIELKLQESEQRYRHLVEKSPAIIYSYIINKGGFFYSSQVESILGYSKEYLLAHPTLWYESIHPEDQPKVDQVVAEFLTKKSFKIEYRIKNAQGEWLWFSDLCFNHYFNEDGELTIEGIAIDITEQKRIEAELRENQKFIQNIVDANPSLLYIYDLTENRNVYLNGDYENILGFTPEEIYKMGDQLFPSLMHPEDLAKASERQEKFYPISDGKVIETEYRFMHKDGNWRWFYSRDIVLNRTENGRARQVLGAALDITKRKQIELELLQSKQFIEQITDASPQILYIVEFPTKNNIYVNRQIEQMLGYTVEEVHQKGSEFFLELWHPEDVPMLEQYLAELITIADGEIRELEYRVRHSDGSIRWLQSRDIVFSRTPEGMPKEILGTATDITKNKQAEQALKASESRFRCLFQTVANVIVVLSPDHKILEWNEEAEKLYGYSQDEVLGKDYFLLFLPPEEREKVNQDMEKVLTGVPTRNIENKITLRNGTSRDIIWNTNPFIDLNGQLLGVIACGQDITDRKRSELALRESEARFRAIFEQAAVGITIFNPSGQYIKFNQKYCDLLKCHPSELLEKTIFEFTYSEDVKESQENLQKLLSGDIDQALMEKRYVTVSGELRWANATISLVSDEAGNPEYFIGILEDIHDRKQAEDQLRFQAQLLDNVRESVVATDLDGKITYWGKGAETLYQYSLEEAIGKPITVVVHAEETKIEIARMKQVLETGYWRGQYEQIRQDGSTFWADTTISLMRDGKDQPVGFIGIDRDITNRKLMEENLQYRLKLETALAHVSQELATDKTIDFSRILGIVGQAIGVNYIELGRFRDDGRFISSIYEWHDAKSSSLLSHFQNIEVSQFSWWFQQLNNQQNVVINYLEEMPEETQHIKEFLRSYQICSILEVPIFDHTGNIWGGISLNTQRNYYKHWLEEDTQLVRVVGEMIYNYYQRRETKEQLQASEALYSGIFNHSADAIFLIKVLPDYQFTYETINPAYEKATGFRLETLTDKTPQQVFNDSMANSIQEAYQRCLEIGETMFYEETLELAIGKRIWRTNLVPIKDSQDRIIKLQGSSRDITQEKEAEEAQMRYIKHQRLLASLTLTIRQSWQIEEILETVVNEIFNILEADRVIFFQFTDDRSGVIVNEAVKPEITSMLNQVFLDQCYQKKAKNYYQNGYIKVCHNVDDTDLEPCYKEFLQSYQIQANLVFPIVVNPLEKEKDFLELSDSIPALTEVKVWGLLGIQQCSKPRYWTDEEIQLLRQITDQLSIALYQAELLKQQTAQQRELARSNQELEQFAYIASHDLQEPLNTVSGYAQLLERRYKGKLDEKADRFLGYMINGVKRMQTQINDLLQYSRVNRKNNPFEPVDCNLIFRKAIANLQLSIHQSQASVEKMGNLPTVMGDPAQMLQLLQNLISNGIKYHSEVKPLIEVKTEQKDNFWEFSIKDNGIGIDPQYHQRIFQIFQRLHTQDEYPGTGIGLAICQRIVERHGGKIWLDSQLNQGSTFYFTIPVSSDISNQ